MKKYLKLSIILIVLTIFYLYIANITLMPKSITLLQGEKLELAKLWGVNIKLKENNNSNNDKINLDNFNETMETSSSLQNLRINKTRQDRYES